MSHQPLLHQSERHTKNTSNATSTYFGQEKLKMFIDVFVQKWQNTVRGVGNAVAA